MRTYIGIDVGTSGTKTALFSGGGELIASHTSEYPMYQPNNGWAEQDPLDWWNAVLDGIRAVGHYDGVRAIGLSGQMHGLVMLDGNGEVLRPAIIWCDQRTSKEAAQLTELIGAERLIRLTGNPAMTGFTAAKILWVRNNEPHIWERCRHILLPKDYIRYKLTGEFATEVSDASGMQLMDISARDWSGEILTKLQIDRALLPKMYESPDVTGVTLANVSALPAGIPVAGGAGDNAAAAIGCGITAEGKAFTTIGSSAVVYAVSDKPRIDVQGRVHALCASVPGKWTVMSCTQGAGLSLKWLRDLLPPTPLKEWGNAKAPLSEGGQGGSRLSYSQMDALAADVPIGAEKLIFLPYLMGERSPHPDADARGVFFGLSAIHGNAQIIRAVLEGVAYSQRECLDVFREMGVEVGDMTFTGGGSKSELWRQMLSDLYNCPVKTLSRDEGAALGAAMLAAQSVGDSVSPPTNSSEAVIPNRERSAEYEPYYQLYKSLYPVLRESYKSLAAL
ncbi:MAG: xylulokinase [Oscillospiraceae bacterium]|jgi:xylulokinase|nr:xylulokinase [Oscillospiraceae bacterium]